MEGLVHVQEWGGGWGGGLQGLWSLKAAADQAGRRRRLKATVLENERNVMLSHVKVTPRNWVQGWCQSSHFPAPTA